MKTCSAALQAHLGQGQTTLAYLWKIKRTDGTILGFTTHDRDITYDAGDGAGSLVYLARTGWTNTAAANKSDLSVDNMEVTGFLDSAAITDSDLRAGLYDNSAISIRVVNWADLTMGDLLIRTGMIGIGKAVNGIFQAEIRGLANKLTTQIVATYGPKCRAIFGSGLNGIDMNSHYLCNFDVTTVRQTGSIAGVTNSFTLVPSGVTGAAGYFNDGIIVFTSGELEDESFEIKSWDGESLTLYLPMFFSPESGDSFYIEPGCNHLISDCQNKFNNIINFRGEPFIPGMDQILNYPNAG